MCGYGESTRGELLSRGLWGARGRLSKKKKFEKKSLKPVFEEEKGSHGPLCERGLEKGRKLNAKRPAWGRQIKKKVEKSISKGKNPLTTDCTGEKERGEGKVHLFRKKRKKNKRKVGTGGHPPTDNGLAEKKRRGFHQCKGVKRPHARQNSRVGGKFIKRGTTNTTRGRG